MSREETIKVFKMSIPELREYCAANPDNEEAKSWLHDKELHEAMWQLMFD